MLNRNIINGLRPVSGIISSLKNEDLIFDVNVLVFSSRFQTEPKNKYYASYGSFSHQFLMYTLDFQSISYQNEISVNEFLNSIWKFIHHQATIIDHINREFLSLPSNHQLSDVILMILDILKKYQELLRLPKLGGGIRGIDNVQRKYDNGILITRINILVSCFPSPVSDSNEKSVHNFITHDEVMNSMIQYNLENSKFISSSCNEFCFNIEKMYQNLMKTIKF